MSQFYLFHMPGACSRVVLNALEEIGVAYQARAVNLLKGEQRSPDLLALNPKGKVPALRVGEDLLTENPAILLYLDEVFPQAGLLPAADDPLDRARIRADLIWVSNTVHPAVRSFLMPARVSEVDAAGVRAGAGAQLQALFAVIEARLGQGAWWHANGWSIMDVYIYWATSTAAGAGFALEAYPAITAHAEQVRARPSFQRALACEERALAQSDIALPPGARL